MLDLQYLHNDATQVTGRGPKTGTRCDEMMWIRYTETSMDAYIYMGMDQYLLIPFLGG